MRWSAQNFVPREPRVKVATRPKNPSKTEAPQKTAARHRKLRNGEPGRALVPRTGTRLGGRAKGTQNKLTRQAKDNLAEGFERLGGVAGLVRWGRNNRTEFYRIWARLIPKDVSIGPSEGLEDLLTKLSESPSNTDAVHGDYIELHAESPSDD